MATQKRNHYVRPAKLYETLTAVNPEHLTQRRDWFEVYSEAITAWQQNVGEGRLPEWVFCPKHRSPYAMQYGQTRFFAYITIIDNQTRCCVLVTDEGTYIECEVDAEAIDPCLQNDYESGMWVR